MDAEGDGLHDGPTVHGSRRSFIRRAGLAIGVALPALSSILSASSAQAYGHRHCAKGVFYTRLIGCKCLCGRYICTWQNTCSVCGSSCGQWTTDEGAC